MIALSFWALGAQAGTLIMDHTPIECVVFDTYSVVEADFEPSAQTDSGRVYFRALGTEGWYFVELKGTEAGWSGVLPQPESSLKGIDYYVLGTDINGDDSKTLEYHPIVADRASCVKDVTTVAEAAKTDDIALVIGITRYGQDAMPSGFRSDGISQIMMPNGDLKSLQQASIAGGTWADAGEVTRTEGEKSLGGWDVAGLVLGGVAVGYGVYLLVGDDENPVINCGTPYSGKGSKKITVTLGQSIGSFLFEWDMGVQKDKMQLIHIGNVTHNTGCTGGSGSALVQFGDDESSKITVSVLGDCEGEGGSSEWSFLLHCPE